MNTIEQANRVDRIRRIRVCNCPSCGVRTEVQPKMRAPKGDVLCCDPYTTCSHCYIAFSNVDVESWLMTHQEHFEY